MVELFYYGGNGGAFGIMVLVALTSLAVLFFFARNGHGESIWARIITPIISLVILGGVVYFAYDGFNNLLGVAPGTPIAWIIPALYPAVLVLGILWALTLKVTKPDVYQAIGLGANTVTGISTQSRVLPGQYAAQHDAPADLNR